LQTTHARWPIKGFEDANISPNLCQEKNGQIAASIFFSGPNDVIQNSIDTLRSDVISKKFKPTGTHIFFIRSLETFCFLRGFEKLSSSIGQQV